MTSAPVSRGTAWRDASLTTDARVAALMAEMTVEEKVAQLYGVWVGADTGGAASRHISTTWPVCRSRSRS